MIWWVNVRGRNIDKDVELFYVIEAESEDQALIDASNCLGVAMLDEVYSVHAERG